MEDWADASGLALSRPGSKDQMYFYCQHIGRMAQKKKGPSVRVVVEKKPWIAACQCDLLQCHLEQI